MKKIITILVLFFQLVSFGQSNNKSSILTSSAPANRWDDALIGGNGVQGVMVYGNPLEETIVFNHEKLWVPAQPVKPNVPDMTKDSRTLRELAKTGEFAKASKGLHNAFSSGNRAIYPEEALVRPGSRLGLNYVHPGLYLKFSIPKEGDIEKYKRSVNLETGEINVQWEDERGAWKRDVFVSRANNIIVTRITKPEKAKLSMSFRFAARPGWNEDDIAAPVIEHKDGQIYLHTYYKKLHGLKEPDGYQAMARVIVKGGHSKVESDHIVVSEADEVLLISRVEYLPAASKGTPEILNAELNGLSGSYDQLLNSHILIHKERFNRVSLDLGGNHGIGKTTEQIIAESANGPTPELLELLFDVGRYSLISSSGELPPTLMGIWGDTWNPRWWGHYTNDSNLNLAISFGSVGNQPEAMESYFGWIESLYPDWELNAKNTYGCRGYMGAISHGWRHGTTIAGWEQWTGASGWLGGYFWQHYLFTGDKIFLENRVVPLLENVVLFYQDFLKNMEGKDGKFLIFPSVSPENSPGKYEGMDPNLAISVNASSEIAIIRTSVNSLIKAYNELGINQDKIVALERFLAKVPDYRINEDGAIAEWSYPNIKDNYDHRHNSHLYAVYPGNDINPSTPKLYEAAKIAINKRIESGQGDKSAHGFMHLGFMGARLHAPEISWNSLDVFAKNNYLNSSLISSHNPNKNTYNLDSTLSLPAIITEMCLISRPGTLDLLPGIDVEKLPTGKIKGILAQKAIIVDSMEWNWENREVNLVVTSKIDQTIAIESRLAIKSINDKNISKNRKDKNEIDLPANVKVHVKIGFAKSK
ncbi:glycosyl hydrolase family 95 catalytic domain-containing protein [Mariniflexile sp. AS56]|uniref:glycosyl hydrolase family 95 catalytic domain-containing protein n=1 Tax=Mariniflexile sp. AS56 TaxID=3063957 RepID=UPI0026EF27A1|nr:glycoside hydrolase N-terminal domain-containing protein [Mariniflexile sp. AS56]MDO7172519.1 glycoside hydrolase N-terminal domain-containing protein [Mariniflexile sp. AS56]